MYRNANPGIEQVHVRGAPGYQLQAMMHTHKMYDTQTTDSGGGTREARVRHGFARI